MGARDRLMDKELGELGDSLDKQESRWVIRKLGVAAIHYAHVLRKLLGFLFDAELKLLREDLLAANKKIEALEAIVNDRFKAAGKQFVDLRAKVADLEKRNGNPTRQQSSRR